MKDNKYYSDFTDFCTDSEYRPQMKNIEELAQDMVNKVQLRFEEIQVENASMEALIKARNMIDKELMKRGIIDINDSEC